ncbi:hypothetical protein RJT34_07726 [Clitoria ternatea]|uniref:Protein kinase domain-containing protein n=1 Tax=Clitoria ternatea TaxID=43366 RepID=A0AAN9K6V5_CLITE
MPKIEKFRLIWVVLSSITASRSSCPSWPLAPYTPSSPTPSPTASRSPPSPPSSNTLSTPSLTCTPRATSNGSVKLVDFGVSASIYDSATCHPSSSSSSSSSSLFTDVAGTPYWMAPEVIHSHTGYSFKADIWSFGITALELAHGRPPLSHLPPSKSMMLKITKRFMFSDFDYKCGNGTGKKFSKAFKDMVASCLDQDPSSFWLGIWLGIFERE